MNLTGLEKYLDLNLPSENMFYAVKIDGNFSYLRARSVPKQEKSYPKLADAVSNQTVLELENVSGILVGFRTPDYMQGVNVPGLIFISSPRTGMQEGMSLSLNLKTGLLF